MSKIVLPTVIAALLTLSACGGGSEEELPRFGGLWSVRYNTLDDTCFLTDPSVVGFNDQYLITQDGTSISIRSTNRFLGEAAGAIDGPDSFTVGEETIGDPYDSGTECLTETRVAFRELNDAEDGADSLLELHRECAGGFVCEARAVGTAVREPL